VAIFLRKMCGIKLDTKACISRSFYFDSWTKRMRVLTYMVPPSHGEKQKDPKYWLLPDPSFDSISSRCFFKYFHTKKANGPNMGAMTSNNMPKNNQKLCTDSIAIFMLKISL
jgi:hypothetical protein